MEERTYIFSTCDEVPKLPMDAWRQTPLPVLESGYLKTSLQLINPIVLPPSARIQTHVQTYRDLLRTGTYTYDSTTDWVPAYIDFRWVTQEGNAWLDSYMNDIPSLETHILDLVDTALQSVGITSFTDQCIRPGTLNVSCPSGTIFELLKCRSFTDDGYYKFGIIRTSRQSRQCGRGFIQHKRRASASGAYRLQLR